MVLVSYSGKEINAKLVYYGPGLSGKTTNLEYIYGSIPGENRGKMVSMKTKTERTLFFDFLPVQLGELSGFKTRFLLYTVPGQVYYNATRKLVLKGVDAVVFVADSKRGKMDENVESLENLKENLREHGLTLEEIPFVLQYNKRDLPDVYTVDELNKVLNPHAVPAYEAVASQGPGVVDTFKAVSRLLLKKLSGEIGISMTGGKKSAAQRSTPEVAPVPPVASSPVASTTTPNSPAPTPPISVSPATASTETFTGGGTGTPTDPNLAEATARVAPEKAPIRIQTQIESFGNSLSSSESEGSSTQDPVDLNTNPDSVDLSVDPQENVPLISRARDTSAVPDGEETKPGSVKQRLARWLRRGEDGESEVEIAPNEPEATTAADSTESSSGFFTPPVEPEHASVFTQGSASVAGDPVAVPVPEPVPEPAPPVEAAAAEVSPSAPSAEIQPSLLVPTHEAPVASGGRREIVVPVRLHLSPADLENGVVLKLDIDLGDAGAEAGEQAA